MKDMSETENASVSLKKELNNLCDTNQKWAKNLLESGKNSKQMTTEITNMSESLDKMSISSVKAAVGAKALNVAMNVGIMLAVSGVIQLIVWGLDKLIVTEKEAVEAASKMQDEYKSLDDEVKSLNSELTTTADRITELQSKGNLSLTEQAELNRLRESSSELAVQLELKEKLRELAAEESNGATMDAINSKTSKVYSGIKYGREGNVFEKGKGFEGVQKQIDKAKELQNKTIKLKKDLVKLNPDSQEYARKSSQINSYDKDLKLLNKDLMNNMNFFMNQRNELVGNSEEVVATREEIDKLSSSYLLLSNGDRTTVFDSILNKHKFKSVRDEIKKLNEEISKENFESKYPELVNDLKKVGLTTEEAIDHINSKFNELNENLDNFADKFTTLKDLTGSAIDSSSLMDSVNKSVDDSGIISLDILDKIGEKYTDLQSVVEQYKLGVLSTSDIYDLISQRYDKDIIDHEKALTEKLLAEEWFSRGVLDNDEKTNNFLNDHYQGDIEQFKEYVNKLSEFYQGDISQFKDYKTILSDIDKLLCETMSDDWIQLQKAKGLAEDEMIKQSLAKLESQKQVVIQTTQLALQAIGINQLAASSMLEKITAPFDEKINKIKKSLSVFNTLEGLKLTSFDTSGVDRLTSSLNSASSAANNAQSAINSLLSMTMNMLKQKYTDDKKALNDKIHRLKELKEVIKESTQTELDGIKKKIDAQLKLLHIEKEYHDYHNGLNNKQKDISNIQSELDKIQFDDSAEAQKKRLKLEEQLSDKKSDLDEYQYNNGIKLQENALNEEKKRVEDYYKNKLEKIEDEYKAKTESLQNQIKDIEDYTSKEVNLRKEAIKLIEGKSQAFYNKLIQWNYIYGDGLSTTISSAWNNCYSALDNYNQGQYHVIATLELLSNKMQSVTQEAQSTANSIKDVIKEANQLDNKDFSKNDKGIYPAKTFYNKDFSLISLPKRHSGGLATYSNLENIPSKYKNLFKLANNETIFKLTNDEMVLTRMQQNNLLKRLQPCISPMDFKVGTNSDIKMGDIIIQGNADKNTVDSLYKFQKDIVNQVFKKINKHK